MSGTRKRQWLLYTTILLLFVFITPLSIAFYYKDTLIAKTIEMVNANIDTKISVGKIDVSVLKSFPNVSFVAQNVLVHSFNSTTDTLAYLGTVTVTFDVLKLIKGRYEVTKLKFNKGIAYLKVYSPDSTNYYVTHPDTSSVANPDKFSFDLNSIQAENFTFCYNDYTSEFGTALFIKSAKSKVGVNPDFFKLDLNSEIISLFIESGKIRTLKNASFEVACPLIYYSKPDSMVIGPAKLKSGNALFALEGFTVPSVGTIDLRLKAQNASPTNLMAWLAPWQPDYVKQIEANGSIDIFATFNGNIKTNNTNINAKAIWRKTDISSKKVNAHLSADSIVASFVSIGANNQKLIVRIDDGKLDQHPIKIDFELANFASPIISLKTEFGIDLKQLNALYPIPYLLNPEGFIEAEINYESKNGKTKLLGELNLLRLSGKMNNPNIEIKSLSGNILMAPTEIALSAFEAQTSVVDVKFTGYLHNLFEYLSNDEKSFHIDGHLSSPLIDIEKITGQLVQNKPKDKTTDQNTPTDSTFKLPNYITTQLKADVDKLVYGKHIITDLKTTLQLRPDALIVNNTVFTTLSGRWGGRANFVTVPYGYMLDAWINLSHIPIDSLFYAFGDFNQTEFTHKNISGLFDANISMTLPFDGKATPDFGKMGCLADIKIVDGTLTDVEALKSLGKFVKEDRLKKLSFGELTNTISFENQTIKIPKMTINSSLGVFDVQGWQSFTGTSPLDYRLVVPLRMLIGRDKDEQFGKVATDNTGTKVFLKIVGENGKIDVAYDRKETFENIKETLRKEKENIRDLFRKKSKDTSDTKTPTEQSPVDEEPEYIDF